jgi:cytochrome P450
MMAVQFANDDLLDPDLIDDPFPFYRELRKSRPVHWNERWRGWIVARYDDVYAGLHDPRMLADTVTPYFQTRLSAEERDRFSLTYEVLNSWSVFVDPPKHTRLRKIFSRSFTPKSVETMRRVVEHFVDEFLTTWQGRDDIDLIDEFGLLMPANVIATIIGAPASDLHRFHRWSSLLNELLHGGVGNPQRMDEAQQAIIEFKDYLRSLYEDRLKQPRDDMMSWLMEVQRSDREMSPDEVLYSCMLMLNAGHETTQILLGNTLASLLASPDQLRRIRNEPGLIKGAIEECLRYNGPMKGTMRVTSEDLKIADVAVKQGDRVMLLMASANRDPSKFDNPDALDITRFPNPHLAFGHGIHFCLGAPLARLEVEIALREMVKRFPRLSLAGQIRYRPRILSRSIAPTMLLSVA